ncbi:MBL fold metallo-hydrolase [Aurantiacibacter odishensis]|uniref:MBL fold metallo-hydrolase n=1 Tax=Aurantiacibacter odishensis TaxID=1155476 RepID=UPI000E721714|nr:MBL fold metallo-hydrolase [Aurantiacibacter odishensis]
MHFRPLHALLAAAFLCAAPAALATEQTDDMVTPSAATEAPSAWVTLGTVGGPQPVANRNEPANLLLVGNDAHLVDVGDGAATSMIRAGVQYADLRSIWISHIHFDHIGGLFGVLGLRLQTRTETPLTIYGPPGTQEIVDGLLAAMQPSARSGFGVPGEQSIDPAASITVRELDDGDVVNLGSDTVRVANNTHYSFEAGTPEEEYYRSLSFRFDLADRSIVYTGDTGPSEAVTELARGADMLVTEVIDLEHTMRRIRANAQNMPSPVVEQMRQHLSTHHVTTDDIGRMAQAAGVGQVVVTHFAGGANSSATGLARYVAEIKVHYDGPVQVANDMDQF